MSLHGEDVFIVKNGEMGMNITLGENIPDRVSKCSDSGNSMLGRVVRYAVRE